MAVDQYELGRRLKQARESADLTQETVSARLEIPRSAIAQIEGGGRAVSSLELDKLAWLYGRDMRAFFAEEFGQEAALSALFRAEPALASSEGVVDALRRCLALARDMESLEQVVGASQRLNVVQYRRPVPMHRYNAINEGATVADQERRRLNLGIAPITDIAGLLEGQGVRTAVIDLPDGVSGITMPDRDAGPFVAVSQSQALQRRNFSFAHEYAHVLMDQGGVGIVSRSAESKNLVEVRANSFAAHFLMPLEAVKAFLDAVGKAHPTQAGAVSLTDSGAEVVEARQGNAAAKIGMQDVVLLSRHFGMSRSAVIYQLQTFRLLGEAQRAALLQDEEAGRGRSFEKMLRLPQLDHAAGRDMFMERFLGLALDAYGREKITRRKLASLMAAILSKDEVEAAMEDVDGDGFVNDALEAS